MNNLDTLLNRTLELGSLMSLGCNNLDSIKEQLIIIDKAVLELQKLQAEVEPILKKLDEEIARIDSIRLAKGAVGIGLMLIGQSNSDNEDLLVQVGSEIALEVGSEFLDEAIHDENHLREVKKIFLNLVNTIQVFIQQGVWLSNIGNKYFLSSYSNFEEEIQKRAKNLSYLFAQIAKLSVSVKLDFCFAQSQLMHEQVASVTVTLEQLNKIKKQLEILLCSVDKNELFQASENTISALFLIFGGAITQIQFSNTSEITIVIDNQQYSLSGIIQKCIEYEQKIKDILLNANYLDKIFSYCLEDTVFFKTLEQVKPKYSIDELCEKATAIIQTVEMRLNFDDLIVMEQNLNRMYRIQVQLRNLYGQLDAVIKKRMNLTHA